MNKNSIYYTLDAVQLKDKHSCNYQVRSNRPYYSLELLKNN